MSQQIDQSDLQSAKDALGYRDLSSEFADLSKDKYKQIIYLCFLGSLSIDQLLQNMQTILGSLPEPIIFVVDLLSYQDIYSVTHSYEQVLEVEKQIRQSDHHQVVMINPTGKFIATLLQKTIHLTGVSVDMIFSADPEQALISAKKQVMKVLSSA
ncbi:hypothetical protein KC640_02765 [Candidatus Dojkabacteria bacterium]|uniref:Uncharacterized protein n=1 Tax=Candidatus Dojkabacteria bacterium TaxID=2099670 RepID=A0A955L0L8_9BACT|nr:hypothetical protein [Candidatus Dojkabacteria bacterium]